MSYKLNKTVNNVFLRKFSNYVQFYSTGSLLTNFSCSIILTLLQICKSHLLINVNTPTQLDNQVFTEHHKCHEGSAEFTQKQIRESALASGKSMPAQDG